MHNVFNSFKKQATLFILMTAVIYGFCINNLNLWSDEIYSVLMAKDSFSEMWVLLTTEDSKPPLYYLYLKGILALFPEAYEIWAAHFSSFLLLIGTQIFAVTEIRKDYGDKVSLWMMALLALMPCSLWLAFEVRTYMLSALLLLATLIYGLRILEKPVGADFIKLGTVTVLALYSHYYCAVCLMFLYLGILFFLVKNKTFSIYGIKFLITAGCAAILFAPWLIVPLSTGGEISRSWYVNFDFVKHSVLFFSNPFEPEIIQSIFYLATQFTTISFSFIVLAGLFSLSGADKKIKRLYFFAFGLFLASYLLLVVMSFAFRPMVTARYLKIFSLLWYIAGAAVLANNQNLAKTFGIIAVALFGFSYADIRETAFDSRYADAVHDIRAFVPKENTMIALDNTNLFCEYYLPEYTCLSIVGEKGEILRKPTIMKNISHYYDKISDTPFALSIYEGAKQGEECLTYASAYRRGHTLKLCKPEKPLVEKLLRDSLNLRLKKH